MIRERLKWLGLLIGAEVTTWLSWKQAAASLPPGSQWVAVGAIAIGFLLYFPYSKDADGTVDRPINTFTTRGRGNVVLAPGPNSPISGLITNTGKGTVNNNGLTVEQIGEIKKHVDDQVADKVEIYVDHRMDAFKREVSTISGEAHTQAMEMGKYVIGSFIEQLSERAPGNITSLGTADMQHAILNAQTAAAVTNDEELADTLVDILVDKSGTEARSFKGVVLTEALAAAAKLTAEQVNLLTAALIVNSTIVHGITLADDVFTMLDGRCRPLYGKMPTSESTIQYLQYTGVAAAQVLRPNSTLDVIIQIYNSIFTKGFSLDQLPQDLQQLPNIDAVFPLVDERFATEDGKRRFLIASTQSLDKMQREGTINEPFASHVQELKALIENQHAPTEKVAALVESSYPELSQFFNSLDKSNVNTLALSSVGMAIGQANWRRIHPESAPPVDIYLN